MTDDPHASVGSYRWDFPSMSAEAYQKILATFAIPGSIYESFDTSREVYRDQRKVFFEKRLAPAAQEMQREVDEFAHKWWIPIVTRTVVTTRQQYIPKRLTNDIRHNLARREERRRRKEMRLLVESQEQIRKYLEMAMLTGKP